MFYVVLVAMLAYSFGLHSPTTLAYLRMVGEDFINKLRKR